MKKPSSLITLGTSAGPSLTPGRAQTSHLLTVNETYYIVDAGDGVARRLARTGADVREVGIIFLTHHHDDHTAGLSTLMSLAWDRQRTEPINVYGPPRTKELVDAAVQYCSISADIRIADGGRSVVQTRQPDHEGLQAVLHADPGRQAAAERERRAVLGLPPFGALARISGAVAPAFMAGLERADGRGAPGVEVMGPRDNAWLVRAPAPETLSDLLASVDRPRGRLRIEVAPARAWQSDPGLGSSPVPAVQFVERYAGGRSDVEAAYLAELGDVGHGVAGRQHGGRQSPVLVAKGYAGSLTERHLVDGLGSFG